MHYHAIETRVARAAEIAAREASDAQAPRLKLSVERLADQLTVTLRKPGVYLYLSGGHWHVCEGRPRRTYGGTGLFDKAVRRLHRIHGLVSLAQGKLTLG